MGACPDKDRCGFGCLCENNRANDCTARSLFIGFIIGLGVSLVMFVFVRLGKKEVARVCNGTVVVFIMCMSIPVIMYTTLGVALTLVEGAAPDGAGLALLICSRESGYFSEWFALIGGVAVGAGFIGGFVAALLGRFRSKATEWGIDAVSLWREQYPQLVLELPPISNANIHSSAEFPHLPGLTPDWTIIVVEAAPKVPRPPLAALVPDSFLSCTNPPFRQIPLPPLQPGHPIRIPLSTFLQVAPELAAAQQHVALNVPS